MFFFGVQPWWPWTSGEAPATRPDCLRLRSGTLRLGPERRRRCRRRTRAHCPPAPSPLLLATRRPPSPSCGPDVRSLPRGWGLCAHFPVGHLVITQTKPSRFATRPVTRPRRGHRVCCGRRAASLPRGGGACGREALPPAPAVTLMQSTLSQHGPVTLRPPFPWGGTWSRPRGRCSRDRRQKGSPWQRGTRVRHGRPRQGQRARPWGMTRGVPSSRPVGDVP